MPLFYDNNVVVAINDEGVVDSSSTNKGINFTVDGLMRVAIQEVGYKEKGVNEGLYDPDYWPTNGNEDYTKYTKELNAVGQYGGIHNGVQWCGIFVDWCFYEYVRRVNFKGKGRKTGTQTVSTNGKYDPEKAGECEDDPDELSRNTANMLTCKNETGDGGAAPYLSYPKYKDEGRFGSYPVKGAQIYFKNTDTGNIVHTGIVIGFTDTTVTTIEGNSGYGGVGGTWCIEYDRSSSRIFGYGYPKLRDLVVPDGPVPADPAPDITNPIFYLDEYEESTTSAASSPYNGLKYSDDYPPLYCPQTTSSCYNSGKSIDIKGVLWHSTGCNNPTLRRYVQPSDDARDREYWLQLLGENKNNNDWNHIEHDAGLSAWIGKLADGTVTTVQTMPWEYKPWGCGSGSNGSCNDGWIQFEICEDNLQSEDYFNEAYDEAVQLTAYLCAKYSIDPKATVDYNGVEVPTILDHITSHRLGLGSDHGDVEHWLSKYEKSMDTVRNDVYNLLERAKTTPVSASDGVKINDVVMVNHGAADVVDGQVAQSYITNHKWLVSKYNKNNSTATLGRRLDAVNNEVVLNRTYNTYDLVIVSADGSFSEDNRPMNTNTGTLTNEDAIWNRLKAKSKEVLGTPLSDSAVAGIMGNMYRESSLIPENLQGSYESTVTAGRTGSEADKWYTAHVDNGTYTNFVNDSAGYGLIQWTYWSLKEYLLNYAKDKGKSIGDLELQVDCVIDMMRSSSMGLTDLWAKLTGISDDVKYDYNGDIGLEGFQYASDLFLDNAERCYNYQLKGPGTPRQKRRDTSAEFYNRHHNTENDNSVPAEEQCNYCDHVDCELITMDVVKKRCAYDGYTGDQVCSKCNQTVKFGRIEAAPPHRYKNGVCQVCGHNKNSSMSGGSCSCEDLVGSDDLRKFRKLLEKILSRGE